MLKDDNVQTYFKITSNKKIETSINVVQSFSTNILMNENVNKPINSCYNKGNYANVRFIRDSRLSCF